MTKATATLQQWLESVPVGKGRFSLLEALGPIFDRFSACAVSSAGLVIKAGGSTLAKTGSATTTLVTSAAGASASTLVQIAASTDMPALTGINITQTYYNVVCFFTDSAGTRTAYAGTQATSLASVVFPAFPTGQALIGFLTIYANTGAFTGGTTALDDATVTTTYNSPTGAWDPSVLVGAYSY